MDATSELAEYISRYEEASGSVSGACATPPPGAPRDVGGHSPRWQLLAEAARSGFAERAAESRWGAPVAAQWGARRLSAKAALHAGSEEERPPPDAPPPQSAATAAATAAPAAAATGDGAQAADAPAAAPPSAPPPSPASAAAEPGPDGAASRDSRAETAARAAVAGASPAAGVPAEVLLGAYRWQRRAAAREAGDPRPWDAGDVPAPAPAMALDGQAPAEARQATATAPTMHNEFSWRSSVANLLDTPAAPSPVLPRASSRPRASLCESDKDTSGEDLVRDLTQMLSESALSTSLEKSSRSSRSSRRRRRSRRVRRAKRDDEPVTHKR